MLREHFINQFDNFICGWYISKQVCDLMIDYHKNTSNKWQGLSGEYAIVNKSMKDSIDCKLEDPTISKIYNDELQKCIDLYIEKYPYCNCSDPWKTVETGNLQYYPPGGGYHGWHSERACYSRPMSSRHLVFITYLNDVTDQGETGFYHQKIKIRPEKGLTIIWPADWTFTHRGITSPTQEKYIYTGWFSYYNDNAIDNLT
jgi:hypothetical protein